LSSSKICAASIWNLMRSNWAGSMPSSKELRDDPVEIGLGLLQRNAGDRDVHEVEAGGVVAGRIVEGGGVKRAFLLDLKLPAEDGGLPRSAEDFGQHGQRGGAALIAGFARGHEVGARDVGVGHALVLVDDAPVGDLRRLLRAGARFDVGIGGDRAVMGFGKRAHLLGRHVARDDQDGVVRPVMRLVEGDQRLAIELLHLVTPADDRDAVGVVVVERGAHLFVEQATGGGIDPLGAFFEDHGAFGHDLFVGEAQVAHAVGLHLHHQAEAVGGHTLEIAGVIPRGEGVVRAAVVLDDAGKLAAFDVVRALEHQVFEEMGDTGHGRAVHRRRRRGTRPCARRRGCGGPRSRRPACRCRERTR
jgi:hypothetical protein